MADYIDRQAAIAAINEYMEDITRLYDSCWNGPVIVAEIKDIISLLPGPWVSVEDKLPPKRLGVAVTVRYDNCTFVSHAWLNSYNEWVGIPAGGTVSSWAPLPDAPEVPT